VIQYEHLLGQNFVQGKSDCYSIVRDFYRDNYGIVLPNYARPTDWWNSGNFNMYMDRFRKNNFFVLDCHPAEYQVGDVFLMSIMSNAVNHAGVLVDKGKMLHHLVNQISTVTPYKGLWRNNTMAVVRHRDVKAVAHQTEVSILDFVPPNVRRKIDEHLRQTQASPS